MVTITALCICQTCENKYSIHIAMAGTLFIPDYLSAHLATQNSDPQMEEETNTLECVPNLLEIASTEELAAEQLKEGFRTHISASPKIAKPETDTNSYKQIVLENGIEVLLASNPVFTTASCAVSVGVGSYDEPEEWPGIAHLLEHVLFMGSKKYPGENEFQNYLSLHNGYSNAYTSDEMTVYYCEADAECLGTVADMLAWFFIGPLFVEDAILREISAVDSEFLHSKNNKYARLEPILALFNKAGERRGRFSYGNDATLRKDGVKEAVMSFWNEKYSSEKIKVVICGPENLGKLKTHINVFNLIPRNQRNLASVSEINIPEINIEDINTDGHNAGSTEPASIYSLFDPKLLGSTIHVQPLDSKKDLIIFVDMPPAFRHFRKNPYGFLAFMFTTREVNGLLSRLKDLRLATSLEFDYDMYKERTRVKIGLELTKAGVERWKDVLHVVSSTLKTYRKLKMDSEYERFRRIQKEEFRFLQLSSPLDFAESTAAVIQDYPVEHCLDWSFLAEEYDSGLLDVILDRLSNPRNWMTVLSVWTDAPNFYDSCCEYYGTKYVLLKEGLDCEADAKELSRTIEESLLTAFSSSTGSLVAAANDNYTFNVITSSHPQKLARYLKRSTNDCVSLSLVFDSQFQLPKAEVFILLQSAFLYDSFSSCNLYMLLVEDGFSERHARLLADSHVSMEIKLVSNGILIGFRGFSARIPFICQLFFSELATVDHTRFEIMREGAIDICAETIRSSPYNRLVDVFIRHVLSIPSVEDYMAALEKMEEAKPITNCTARVVAVGNISWESVVSIGNVFEKGEQFQMFAKKWSALQKRIVFGTHDENNSAVALIYRITEYPRERSECDSEMLGCMRDTAIGGMIHQIANEEFFNELRTEDELGYCVSVSIISALNGEYLSFMVQSEKSPEFLRDRICRFVSDMKDDIREMPDEEYEAHRASLISSYTEPIINLSELSNRSWKQSQKYGVRLDFYEKLAETVQSVTKMDILGSEILDSYIFVSSTPIIGLKMERMNVS